MIPSNILLTQLLPLNELTVQPTAQSSAISDKLSDLIPGQRVLAEIQSRLPNGAYRAAIGQHDVTLSLNFSAKPGDTLELDVVENNGRLALAISSKGLTEPPALQGSVATSLSRVGQLISSLTTTADGKPIQPEATPLNKGQPILSSTALEAVTLAPILQSSVEKSGLFYEAHLARWTFGNDFTEQQLRQEPQSQLQTTAAMAKPLDAVETPPIAANPIDKTLLRQENSTQALSIKSSESTNTPVTTTLPPPQAASEHAPATIIAPELTPLVQQQLASLNNQPLQWQGQLVPGQNFYWEIIKDEEEHNNHQDESTPSSWQTRLRLSLPELGDIEARLYIKGVEIRLILEARDATTRDKLVARKGELRNNLATSGLTLTSIGISPPPQVEAP